MSTADGGLAVQWGDTGTADHNWVVVTDGDAVRFRNVNSGKVLGVENMSTADNARVLQWADNGTADHRWILLDQGDGTYKIRNVNSGKLLGILNGSTARAPRPYRTPTTAARTTAGGSSPTSSGWPGPAAGPTPPARRWRTCGLTNGAAPIGAAPFRLHLNPARTGTRREPKPARTRSRHEPEPGRRGRPCRPGPLGGPTVRAAPASAGRDRWVRAWSARTGGS